MRQIIREFLIYASLSFIISLGIIHALLNLLHIYATLGSELGLPSPLAEFLNTPTIEIYQIAEAHEVLLKLSKVVIACIVLVIAIWEISSIIDGWFGWFVPSAKEVDVEAGYCKPPILDVSNWWADEKVALSEVPHPGSIPTSNESPAEPCSQ